MGISSAGIGSGLKVDDIVSKLMAVESQPLADYDKKSASYLSQVSAFGNLSGALGSFQGVLSGLTSVSSFQTLVSTPSDATVMTATASSTAQPGTYRVNINQLAQAQTLASGGYKTTTAAIGLGAKTTINFSLGTVSGGSFGITGTQLGASLSSGGLSPGSLSINNTVIASDGTTRSARLLADAINAKSTTTGVSAKAAPTVTNAALFGAAGASTFGNIDTSAGGTYALTVGGVEIAAQATGVAGGGAGGVSAASIDAALTGNTAVTRALADANITVTGTAAAGTLQFTNADGSNIAIAEAVTGSVTGGIGNSGTANIGSSTTAVGSISLVSADGSPITIGGTNPAGAGLTAGVGGAYLGASFTADSTRTSGNIVIDSSNNTLQGIMAAINKGGFGVTASIVSDGSTGTNATPNHLILTSTATGVTSTMKITLAGSGGNPPDPDLVSLLGYDPGGVQNLSQKSAAADTLATVNGIAVTSSSTSIGGAIAGVSISALKVGSSTLSVSKDSGSLTTAVSGFVKAYNDLTNQIKQLGGYDPDTKTGGPLLGDPTLRNLQASIRRQLGTSITGLQGTSLTNLSQIGISFQKDGSLTLDNSKLQKAITNNFNDIAGLFAAVGHGSDPDVKFASSGTNTKAGDYSINITQLATQGTLQGTNALPAETVIDADTTWTVTLNDTSPPTLANTATISLPAGSYNPSQLATLLQSSINGVSAFSNAGATVTATVGDDGKLKLASTNYGSKSNIHIATATGTDISAVFGTGTSVDGLDVAGTIGGYTATGSGQTLTGSPGAPVDGLKLTITGDAVGSRGSFGFSQGYAYQLNSLAAGYLGAKGAITSRTTGLNNSVKDIAKQKDAFASRLTDIEARYRAQYTALDTSIASMNTTASFLTQQFAAMAKQ
ncbi:flagellar hook protein 2 [Duganella sp. BJB488]|uniref:flagellar filament capping protein FliD n=1 Tax=unclassified Duganella TaxID=2636909 RepID=UPI000E341294|nr:MULTISPECIES: flagellar filament capping protein FliD [unclassified Duganella]RFP25870.1 flagellar hook protein 2 [Duganella sp. BJB489]RFP28389.1 flagellar hook protein 2 [Duganella sp. BJB488]RFP36800.1 flagellar hook protein 2 [Duganella sp. BJB480]